MCGRVDAIAIVPRNAPPSDNDIMKKYTVSDGKLVLTLMEAEEGGYVVTSPLDPQLITEAETVAEAFEMARDAIKALARSRAKLLR
jgi:antitoxin HicB